MVRHFLTVLYPAVQYIRQTTTTQLHAVSGKVINLLHTAQTRSGAHATPLSNGVYRQGDQAGVWSQPLPASVEVKNNWIYTSAPLMHLNLLRPNYS
jgi:hypothetical protein